MENVQLVPTVSSSKCVAVFSADSPEICSPKKDSSRSRLSAADLEDVEVSTHLLSSHQQSNVSACARSACLTTARDGLNSSTATIDSQPNASAINIQNKSSTIPDFNGLHKDYLAPPKMCHPLEENMMLTFCEGLFEYVLGFIVAVPVLLIVFIALIIILPLRVLFYIVCHRSCRGLVTNLLSMNHCDPFWPLDSTNSHFGDNNTRRGGHLSASSRGCVFQCLVTVQGDISLTELQSIIMNRIVSLKDSNGNLKFPAMSKVLSSDCCNGLHNSWANTGDVHEFPVSEHVTSYSPPPANNQDSTNCGVQSLVELEARLNKLINTPFQRAKPMWSTEIIANFGQSECTLIIFRLHSLLLDDLCVPKLLCLLAGGQPSGHRDSPLSFDFEPKLRGTILPPYNLFVSMSYTLWTWCQVVYGGPISLIKATCARPGRVWKDVMHRSSNNNRSSISAGSKLSVTGSQILPALGSRRTTLSTPGALIAPGGNSPLHAQRSTSQISYQGSLSAIQVPTLTSKNKRITWARVPNVDQIVRSERIMRASTLELLLAFVAGAFRRHFRSCGLRQPPNITMSMPVSQRDYMPVSGQHSCKFVMVPMQLPCGTEGCIPRIWEVQRLLADAIDDPYPHAFRAFRAVGDLILPRAWVKKMLLSNHSASGCFVSYIKVGGDLNLSSKKIHSVLLHHPLPENCKAGFTFVHSGHEMVVSVTVDHRVFPEPDSLLTDFQAELQGLLRQLSVRLLTLSQATFLPSPAMTKFSAAVQSGIHPTKRPPRPVCINTIDESGDIMSSSEDQACASGSSCVKVEGVIEGEQPHEETLEELEKLLASVQDEMDCMRHRPHVASDLSRLECINRLSQLEKKMEAFHRSVSSRLGSVADDSLMPVCGVECTDPLTPLSSVEAVIQPLKQETSRASGIGRERGSFRLGRRRSKRTNSPTRVSPQVRTPSRGDLRVDYV